MWIVTEWSDYQDGPTRIAVWSDITDAEKCRDDWRAECAGCKSIRVDLWDAKENSGKCPWENSGERDVERKAILDKAIDLIKNGKTDCLFKALHEVAGTGWNGGFGRGASMVLWDNGEQRSHVAYAATRLAIPNKDQALMCFSQSASKEEMIEVLERAKNVEIK